MYISEQCSVILRSFSSPSPVPTPRRLFYPISRSAGTSRSIESSTGMYVGSLSLGLLRVLRSRPLSSLETLLATVDWREELYTT
jgi:hypothetical protein